MSWERTIFNGLYLLWKLLNYYLAVFKWILIIYICFLVVRIHNLRHNWNQFMSTPRILRWRRIRRRLTRLRGGATTCSSSRSCTANTGKGIVDSGRGGGCIMMLLLLMVLDVHVRRIVVVMVIAGRMVQRRMLYCSGGAAEKRSRGSLEPRPIIGRTNVRALRGNLNGHRDSSRYHTFIWERNCK